MSPSFRTGAEEAAKAAQSSSASSFSRTPFLSLKNGERVTLRFLTDWPDIPTVAQHSMIATRPAPSGYKGNWPQSNTAICRKDVGLREMGYADCFICDHTVSKQGKPNRPAQRQWALAVLREEVMENGRLAGYKDAVRSVQEFKDGTATGAVTEEKAIVVVNMGYKNFFGALDNYHGIYGTILDRDYMVRRSGDGLETDYAIVPLDPITLADGRRYDLREADLMARYEPLPDLVQMLVDRASDTYYARFFDTRLPQPESGFAKGGDDAPVAQVTNDVANPVDVADLAARLRAYSEPQK